MTPAEATKLRAERDALRARVVMLQDADSRAQDRENKVVLALFAMREQLALIKKVWGEFQPHLNEAEDAMGKIDGSDEYLQPFYAARAAIHDALEDKP